MEKLKSSLCVLLLISCIVLNSTAFSNIFIISILLVLALLNYKSLYKLFYIKLIVLITVFISFLINTILKVEMMFDIQRIIPLVLLFMLYPIKFTYGKYFNYLVLLSLLYITIIQIMDGYDFPGIYAYLNDYYPIDENKWDREGIGGLGDLVKNSARFGGIYYNPNVMGQTVLFLLVFLLGDIHKGYLQTIFLFSLVILAVIFSGSRTAMVTLLILSFFYLKQYLKNRKYFFYITISAVVLFLTQSIIIKSRALDLSNTFNDSSQSGTIKLTIFLDWLNKLFSEENINLLKVSFGIGNYEVMFDADPGYLLSYFGFIGVLIITIYFFNTFKQTVKEFKFVYFLLLLGIGATIIINFRFSILFFLIISYYNSENYLFVPKSNKDLNKTIAINTEQKLE